MKNLLLSISLCLVILGCNSKRDAEQPIVDPIQPTLQAVLKSKQFDSLVNGMFEFRGKQLTIIRNDLIKTDIPLTMNNMPVVFTSVNLKAIGKSDPFKPVFHAELTSFKPLTDGSFSLAIAIHTVGLLCNVQGLCCTAPVG